MRTAVIEGKKSPIHIEYGDVLIADPDFFGLPGRYLQFDLSYYFFCHILRCHSERSEAESKYPVEVTLVLRIGIPRLRSG